MPFLLVFYIRRVAVIRSDTNWARKHSKCKTLIFFKWKGHSFLLKFDICVVWSGVTLHGCNLFYCQKMCLKSIGWTYISSFISYTDLSILHSKNNVQQISKMHFFKMHPQSERHRMANNLTFNLAVALPTTLLPGDLSCDVN